MRNADEQIENITAELSSGPPPRFDDIIILILFNPLVIQSLVIWR